jgi:hypothetical protein
LEGSDSDSGSSYCSSDRGHRRYATKKSNNLAHNKENSEKITLADALQALELLTANKDEAPTIFNAEPII